MAGLPLFISYAREDREQWFEPIRKQLTTLESDGVAEVWHDFKLGAADESGWYSILMPKLRTARIVVAILSPNYAAKPFCQQELDIALEMKRAGKARVFFVLAEHYAVEQKIRTHQIRPSLDSPLSAADDQGLAIRKIVEEIGKHCRRASETATSSLPYLYDRHDQEDDLFGLVKDSNRATKPIVFFVAGPPTEQHFAFHDRIAREFLKKHGGMKPLAPRSFEWPKEEKRMAARLGREIGEVKKLPPGITYLSAYIHGWEERHDALLREFLDYFSGVEVPAKKAICAAVSIQCDSPNACREVLKAKFRPEDFPQLRFDVISDLAPPDKNPAATWVNHPRVRQFCDAAKHLELKGEVEELFVSTPRIPMNVLKDSLMTKLLECV